MSEIPLFPDKEFELKSIPHAISYRTKPGVVLHPLGSKDLTKINIWQEGCIYSYGVSRIANQRFDHYLVAKVMHAQLLAGVLACHPWAKHIKPDPEKGVEMLVAVTNCNRPSFLETKSSKKKAEESLGYLEGTYALLMACAHNTGHIHDQERLVVFLKFLTQPKGMLPMRGVLVTYFLELFAKRQAFLKGNLKKIAEHNKCSEDEIAQAIIKRTKVLPLTKDVPILLMLAGDTTDIYPIEMVLYLNHLHVADAVDSIAQNEASTVNP